MRKLGDSIRNWMHNEKGGFAVYTALAFPLLLALAGFGLDYWSTLAVKARLDAAVDTAAIAAAKAANAFVQANTTLSGTTLTNAAIAAGAAAAGQAFYANAGASEIYTPVAPTISVTYQNAAFTATVSYSTTRPTMFAGIVGVPNLGLSGTSTATQHQLTYINIYVLVDTSQSMGIASNQTQMNALYAASSPLNIDGVGVGCVFGCHVPTVGTVSMETVAHNNNIQLRIDVARAAIYNMAVRAQAEAVNSNIKFAVYSMQQPPGASTVVSQVYPATGVTSDYAALQAAMAPTSYVLDLGPNNSGGVGDSNQATSLSQFAQSMPSQGDGSSALSPLNYVYIITDGAIDVPGACTFGHCMQAIPSTACGAIKFKGATVGVVYTTYINIYTLNQPALGLDFRFQGLVQPIVGQFPGNLSSCSSGSGWYYEASDDTALLNAVNNLFASTLTLVRLTN
jgi:Flp pilus assembly protein TadG